MFKLLSVIVAFIMQPAWGAKQLEPSFRSKSCFKVLSVFQDIGWYDDHKNSVGALTTRLATDASLVQGVGKHCYYVISSVICHAIISVICYVLFSVLWQHRFNLNLHVICQQCPLSAISCVNNVLCQQCHMSTMSCVNNVICQQWPLSTMSCVNNVLPGMFSLL